MQVAYGKIKIQILVESIFLIAPAFFLTLFGTWSLLETFLFFIKNSNSTIDYFTSIYGIAAILASYIGLFILFKLIKNTIALKSNPFRFIFWFGILMGVYANYFCYIWLGLNSTLITSVPIVILIIRLFLFQSKLKKLKLINTICK